VSEERSGNIGDAQRRGLVGDEALPDEPAAEPAALGDEVSSLRMILTLGAAGALAGLLIVMVFNATLPAIEAHRAEAVRLAVTEVLQQPARYEALSVTEAGLVELPREDVQPANAVLVYVGFDEGGRATGVAVTAAEAGFQDIVGLIYGFDPQSGTLLGMKVLESKETPGLGDKIQKDARFVAQFAGARPPLEAVKRPKGEEGEIDSITGATISSRAVVRIINNSLERLRPRIEAHFQEVVR